MENEILEIAKLVEFNAKGEAQAVYDYTEMLNKTLTSDIEETDKDVVKNVISEIISDELNHKIKLRELYTLLTGIEANKE